MGFYPVVVNVRTMPVLLVGGGVKALAKLLDLAAADARVTIVAPEICPQIAEVLRQSPQMTWHRRRVGAQDVRQARLVIVADVPESVCRRIARWARIYRTWMNAVDRPAYCDVFATAQVRRGDLVIAISTSGRAPALAKAVRQQLDEQFGDEWSEEVAHRARIRTTANVTHQSC